MQCKGVAELRQAEQWHRDAKPDKESVATALYCHAKVAQHGGGIAHLVRVKRRKAKALQSMAQQIRARAGQGLATEWHRFAQPGNGLARQRLARPGKGKAPPSGGNAHQIKATQWQS